MPFETTKQQIEIIHTIAQTMKEDGVSESFVNKVALLAVKDQGVFSLMEIWFNGDVEQQEAAVDDLWDSLADYDMVV